ncbi:MAG: sigma-54-dependent Fis family transcriptional regulator [Candidatus Zixiibacteriota bacterium]|nr:MAG: sigma-54-dependent Fis family transcriptional regulator [candidate division Zixibacteria bacterium]
MTEIRGKLLVVDDDEDILQAAALYLKRYGFAVITEKSPEKIPSLISDQDFDVILLDMNFTKDVSSGKEGIYWLKKILNYDPEAVTVMITAFGDIELSVEAIKAGAIDFIQKPWQNEKLLGTIMAGISLRKSRKEVEDLRSKERQLSADLGNHFPGIIGDSGEIREVFATIDKVAGTDANVLILGESGTGKELIAREIHRRSKRSNKTFITVDMGALTETLFESELFGHKKGAFTDAREDRAGRFEIANGGTLFLDEIGNIPVPLQAKLLSILQNRNITRLGTNRPIPIDVRLISATNMPIPEMIETGRFRQDLLYRINTVEVKIAPLRERAGDIPLLINHFLKMYSKKYNKDIKGAAISTIRKLEKYHWPGNVRELEHAVERAVIMCDSEMLKAEDFFLADQARKTDGLVVNNFDLEEVEKAVILRVMTKNRGNISLAAKELGLTRASLYRRIQKYEL